MTIRIFPGNKDKFKMNEPKKLVLPVMPKPIEIKAIPPIEKKAVAALSEKAYDPNLKELNTLKKKLKKTI
jgi:hypothetical protein